MPPRNVPPISLISSSIQPPRLTPVRTMAITSGKGGVGKTNIAMNMAVALAEIGKRTLLLDADLGLANVDVLLGLNPQYTLADLIAGKCEIQDVLVEGPSGLLIAPAASGRRSMTELKPAEHIGLVNVFSQLDLDLDIMLVDTAAGINDGVLTFCQAAQDVIVVVCDEPASITDAYALMKVLSYERGVSRFQIVASMVRNAGEGRQLFNKLNKVCEKFLGGVLLHYLGAVPQDDWLRLAVQRQQSVVKTYPASPSAQSISDIAKQTLRWKLPSTPRGNVEFFVERIIQNGVLA